MNDELSYAEMLEIPVETVTVKRKEKRKRAREEEVDRLVEKVNDRMETEDPAYAESTPIEREVRPSKKASVARKVLIGEFAAVCILCAAIFLTNLFMTDSAINTFVRGLFRGNASAADTRTYADFTLSPVVNDTVDAEIAVSETGVLSFTAKCSVYSPCAGKIESVSGDGESGYSVRIRHSDSFSTIFSGLDAVYETAGEEVKTNIPFAWTDGEGEVRVMFYDGETLVSSVVVGEEGMSWS